MAEGSEKVPIARAGPEDVEQCLPPVSAGRHGTGGSRRGGMGWDGMRRIGSERVGSGQDGSGWEALGQDRRSWVGQDRDVAEREGRDGTEGSGWVRLYWDGMRRDGVGWDRG